MGRLAVALNLMSSSVTKHWPWSPILSLGKSARSPSVRYGEYGGSGMSVICFPAKNCYTAIAMWPGELSWCRTHLISFHLICSCINATPQLLYPWERPSSQCTGGWVGTRAGLGGVWKILPPPPNLPPGIRSPDCQARTESLYRLRYLGPTQGTYKHQTWPTSKMPKKLLGENMKLVFSI